VQAVAAHPAVAAPARPALAAQPVRKVKAAAAARQRPVVAEEWETF
jgi:hypothetical protein